MKTKPASIKSVTFHYYRGAPVEGGQGYGLNTILTDAERRTLLERGKVTIGQNLKRFRISIVVEEIL